MEDEKKCRVGGMYEAIYLRGKAPDYYKTPLFTFPGWLPGCSFWAARSGASGARARPRVNLLGLGRLRPRKLASPASSGVGSAHTHNLTSHVTAQDASLIQKT